MEWKVCVCCVVLQSWTLWLPDKLSTGWMHYHPLQAVQHRVLLGQWTGSHTLHHYRGGCSALGAEREKLTVHTLFPQETFSLLKARLGLNLRVMTAPPSEAANCLPRSMIILPLCLAFGELSFSQNFHFISAIYPLFFAPTNIHVPIHHKQSTKLETYLAFWPLTNHIKYLK